MRATIANFSEFFGIGFIVAALVTALVIVLRRRFQPKPDLSLSGAERKELLRSLPRSERHQVRMRYDTWSSTTMRFLAAIMTVGVALLLLAAVLRLI
jgi:hypothetical protein